jgi:hypothetical protein
MTYAQDLAAVGLHPDNPDGMLSELQRFLSSPQAYKNAQSKWRGARDDYAWWEEPKGKATLMWPFHSGKWLDAAPKNDAQIRAVFKIPNGMSTAAGLSRAYSHPGKPGFPLSMPYWIRAEEWKDGGNAFDDAWNGVKQGVGAITGVADTFKIPGVNFTAALLTGQDPIAALKKDMANFTDSTAIAKGIVSGDMGPLKASITSGAAKFGVNLPPSFVDAAAAAYKSGDLKAAAAASMGPGYEQAWKVATNDGKLFDPSLPAPPGLSYVQGAIPAQSTSLDAHPAIAAAKKVPLHLALKSTPLKNELSPDVKAAVVAQTGIDAALLAPKKKPWWAYGAGGGAAVGFAVGGPVGAAIGAAVGGVGAHVAMNK